MLASVSFQGLQAVGAPGRVTPISVLLVAGSLGLSVSGLLLLFSDKDTFMAFAAHPKSKMILRSLMTSAKTLFP